MDLDQQNYPGGFFALMRRLETREAPFDDPLSVLPPPDVDLNALKAALVSCAPDMTSMPENRRHALRKQAIIRAEFVGQSELWALHAVCIAILRRRAAPPQARQLFLRIWSEQGGALARELPVRWMISAAATFADHGETMDQRLGGQGLMLLFDLIKLHDSERRQSGQKNSVGFPRTRGGSKPDDLGFGLEPYSLPNGDLDKNMLARLWRYAENDAVLRPLGTRMLQMVMNDPRSIFARIQRYKNRPASDER
ncbi:MULTISPECIES: hypothetical protein [unclassified Leisingera]|uniref:hypothetical protein n=1 Tax=unclassified Leisingera TaxID=2614906 RepID=UPI0010138F6F|nr:MULTISPECIES: hypothetical protein [unclassified Leisingera]MBQ4823722.1 hypothetical protein [Leisingera sp. HS039]QAX30140.1 hypothetical protein ETW24_12655 [Leisingera sp. NJS204]QBR35917.1 hypothetical protein ETW23_06945 [Leisingera sp. NJS201]